MSEIHCRVWIRVARLIWTLTLTLALTLTPNPPALHACGRRAMACKVGTPELRRGAVPHVRLDQLAYVIYRVKPRPFVLLPALPCSSKCHGQL